jgi:DNA invertase Pin-like site-specific DNA recombinase
MLAKLGALQTPLNYRNNKLGEVKMQFGYARVSTKDQSTERQVHALEAYGCEEIFSETGSGANDDRPELKRMLDKLREGDTVVVTSLDRLGRRMLPLLELFARLKEKGIHFIALDNNINTSTPLGQAIMGICAAFAEMERLLIKERVQSGLAKARSQGRTGGRKSVVTPEKKQQIHALRLANTFSAKQICNMVGVSKSVYYRAIAC